MKRNSIYKRVLSLRSRIPVLLVVYCTFLLNHVDAQRRTNPTPVPTSVPTATPTLSVIPSSFPTWSDCVSMVQSCQPWSSVIGSTNQTEKVTIPCEVCVTMEEFTNGEVIDLQGGLDIEGILRLPDGTKLTMRTPFIFVQGELYMEALKKIDGNVSIKVIMTGTDDVFFIPHVRNKVKIPVYRRDPLLGYPFGKKVILVAGGKIDIRGFPEYAPTWEHPLHVARQLPPTTNDFVLPEFKNECKTELLNANETSVLAKHAEGYEFFDVKDDESYCNLIPDKKYLFSARLRLISRKAGGESSECSSTGRKCVSLRMTRTSVGDIMYNNTLASMSPDEAAPDEQWFNFQGEIIFNKNQTENYDDVYFEISEEDVDIEIQSFEIITPPHAGYPKKNNVCRNLAINGDAERDVYPFPMRSFLKDTKVQVREDENGNHYFHLGDRSEFWSSLTFDVTNDCLRDQHLYHFSARIRINSDEPVRSVAYLKVIRNNEDNFFFKRIKLCRESSKLIGWIDCSADVIFDERFVDAKQVHFLLSPQNNSTDDIDMDDISFTFLRSEDQPVRFSENVTHAWSPGAEVIVASQTFNWDEEQILHIESVDDTGTVRFEENFMSPPSKEEEPEYAGEFALLSRNIVFDAEDDDEDNPYHGGHLMIYKTPHCSGRRASWACDGYTHHIEGALFTHFGQEGEKDRFPINVFDCKDSRESTFKWNAFNETFQRCINIYRTSRVTIEGNVAYNTAGACYVVERKPANKNEFYDNFGARTIRTRNSAIGGFMENKFPATFVFTDPGNYIVGNVAAGSEGVGYWYYNPWKTRSGLAQFNNNVAHSIAHNAIQVFPFGWDPKRTAVFQNTKVYRNRGIGWYCHWGENFLVKNSLFADNRIGVDVNYCDKVEITKSNFIGYTQAYEDLSSTYGLRRHCWDDNFAMYGVRTHPNNKNTRQDGSKLTYLDFSRYQNKVGCKPNKAIIMNDDRDIDHQFMGRHVYNVTVDSKYVFKNLTYDEPIKFPIHQNLFDFCELNSTGINDMYIADSGHFNPEQNGYGFIINDHPNMTMWSEKCVELKDTCAKYCTGPGSCMTKITIGVDIQETENITLRVFRGNKKVRGVDGIAIHDYAQYESRRQYWFYLPAGNYTGEFHIGDKVVWPTFAEVMTNHPHEPNCPGYEYNFELRPPPVEDACEDLAINGDLEDGVIGSNRFFYSDTQWFHYEGSGLLVVDGFEGGKAVQTNGRSNRKHGIYQFLDTRCMVEGKRYEIEARVKVADGCNPNTRGTNRCPRASIRSRYEGWDLNVDFALAETLSPFVAEEWNTMFGMYTMSQDMVDSDNIAIFFEGPDKRKDFALDHLSITPVIEQCENLIFNSDAESGDHRYWTYMGDNTGINPVDNSKYGEIGYSLTTLTRTKYWNGISQEFKSRRCMEVGMILEVSVDYRLEDGNGDLTSCEPALKYRGVAGSCPVLGVRVVNSKNKEKREVVGNPYGPYKPSEWNKIIGHFEVTQEMMDARNIDIYVNGAPAGTNIIIDNMVMKEADLNTYAIEKCPRNLVLNGDAEIGDARSWYIKGNSNFGDISLVDGSDSVYAFHHTGRTKSYHGLWQYLDQDCMDVGSEWLISADFKLFDENGNGVECDPITRYDTPNAMSCPTFLFQSHSIGGRLYQTQPLLNIKKTRWIPNQWNKFQSVFKMTSAHKAKDSTWFFIHNVRAGYSYTIDNIQLIPYSESEINEPCDNFVYNAQLERGDTGHWKWVGQGLKLDVVDSAKYGEAGHSLTTIDRKQTFDGITQEITKRHCFEENMLVEVSVDYRLEDSNGDSFFCEPLLKYLGRPQSCPVLGVKLVNPNSTPKHIKFGTAIGPFDISEWNKIYGTFEVTQAMMNSQQFEIFVNGAPRDINLIIDNMVVKRADGNTYGIEKCPSNLVLNGDAEFGDARSWYIKGSGNFGAISLVDGADSNYAFHHTGRSQKYHGIWQYLDQDCMDVGSEWSISANFKLFDANGNGVACDPSIRYDTKFAMSCPIIMFQSHSEGGRLVNTPAFISNTDTAWAANDWNSFKSVFSMTSEHKAKESTWFYIHNVRPGYSYSIDNVKVVRISESTSS